MAARSTATIATELGKMIPAHTAGPASPLLGGMAAGLAAAEAFGYGAANSTLIGGAEEKWLDLIARGMGTARAEAETDEGLRTRLRNPQFGITKANIKAAVDAVLAAYGLGECLILEWFEGPALDVDAYLDFVSVVDAPNWFLVVAPSIATSYSLDFLDFMYLDRDSYLGTWTVDPAVPAYDAVVALVNTLRAAGVRFSLYIDTTGVYL